MKLVAGIGRLLAHRQSEPQVCPPTCEAPAADFNPLGIQRAMDLSREEFYAARIVEWGGVCAEADAIVELGIGGRCQFTPTGGGQLVTVDFEPRPVLSITVSGHPDAVSNPNNYYQRIVTPQDQPDAPAPEVRWECAESSCIRMGNFDLGTEVRIEPTGTDSLRRWGGDCGGVQGADNAVLAQPCAVVLDADTEVTMQRSLAQCQGISNAPTGQNVVCTYDPP